METGITLRLFLVQLVKTGLVELDTNIKKNPFGVKGIFSSLVEKK